MGFLKSDNLVVEIKKFLTTIIYYAYLMEILTQTT